MKREYWESREKEGYKVLSVEQSRDWISKNDPPQALGKNAIVYLDNAVIENRFGERRVLLRADTLSAKKKAEAEKVKKWLKEQNYTVFRGGLSPPNESVGLASGLAAGTDSGSGKVTMMNLGFDTNIGASKYRVSIEGVGSAVFIFDKNGELQFTK